MPQPRRKGADNGPSFISEAKAVEALLLFIAIYVVAAVVTAYVSSVYFGSQFSISGISASLKDILVQMLVGPLSSVATPIKYVPIVVSLLAFGAIYGKKALDLYLGAAVYLLFYIVLAVLFTSIVAAAYNGRATGSNYTFLLDFASLVPLSIAAVMYLSFYKKAKTGILARVLGLSAKRFWGNVAIGLLVFVIILLFELLVGMIGVATGTQINTNANVVFAGAPVWFLLFAALIEPINEEIMFRGFLAPRIGIIPSALIFGIAHYSYMSTFGIEIIGAFIFGMIAGYVFRRTKSIYPGMVAHILVNTVAVIGLMAAAS
jgi:membrane protease YdiL (CAAX protease family)